jgi:hypothetical protein
MMRAVAKEKDLTKPTLRHIMSVLGTIFTFPKNEGAFDAGNRVDDVLIPWNAGETRETHAYDLGHVLQILGILRLLAKSLVATSAFAGIRRGELCGLEWTNFTGTEFQTGISISVGGRLVWHRNNRLRGRLVRIACPMKGAPKPIDRLGHSNTTRAKIEEAAHCPN